MYGISMELWNIYGIFIPQSTSSYPRPAVSSDLHPPPLLAAARAATLPDEWPRRPQGHRLHFAGIWWESGAETTYFDHPK